MWSLELNLSNFFITGKDRKGMILNFEGRWCDSDFVIFGFFWLTKIELRLHNNFQCFTIKTLQKIRDCLPSIASRHRGSRK